MRRSRGRFSEPESLVHAQSLADFITNMFEFRFSVHTRAFRLIGAVPGIDGAYVATGHSVWGMLNAPATGEAMSELILDGAAHHVDLAPFAPGRLPPLDLVRLRGPSGPRVSSTNRAPSGASAGIRTVKGRAWNFIGVFLNRETGIFLDAVTDQGKKLTPGARKREIDDQIFKYVGVAGVDKA